eukprot:2209273-Amphidinium_carterae.1
MGLSATKCHQCQDLLVIHTSVHGVAASTKGVTCRQVLQAGAWERCCLLLLERSDPTALAVRVAAVRQTFERTGMMIAGRPPPDFARSELRLTQCT